MIISYDNLNRIIKLGGPRTIEEVEAICKWFGLKDYKVNNDLSVDVNGNVDISKRKLSRIPIKFNSVRGHFFCHFNNLKSLENSPEIVEGGFNCSENQLTSLKYGPKEVYSFDCSRNLLKDLKFSPKKVKGIFDCSQNQLRTLEGAPRQVKAFDCSHNYLKNLDFLPNAIEEYLVCVNNRFEMTSNELIEDIKRKCYIKYPKEIYLV